MFNFVCMKSQNMIMSGRFDCIPDLQEHETEQIITDKTSILNIPQFLLIYQYNINVFKTEFLSDVNPQSCLI